MLARQIAMFLIRKHTKLSLVEIGRKFKKDHSTIIHGLQKINDYLHVDRNVHKHIAQLEKALMAENVGMGKKFSIHSEPYYIDLTNCSSVCVGDDKYIIFTGMTDNERKSYLKKMELKSEVVEHDGTGIYLIQPYGNNKKEQGKTAFKQDSTDSPRN